MPLLPALLAVLAAAPAYAGDPTPPTVRWTRARVLTVEVEPADGDHLSADLGLKAVLDDGDGYLVEWNEPAVASDGPTTLQLPLVRTRTSTGWALAVSGGVCNDDESICLPFHAEFDIGRRGPRKGLAAATAGRPAKGTVTPPTGPVLPPSPPRPTGGEGAGLTWHLSTRPGDLDRAWTLARKTDKPLLVDVFATWYPPCDRLRDEFLEDPARASLLARFVLVKIDADHPSSFELKDRYAVGGYPTVLVVQPDGTLTDRLVGYAGPAATAVRLQAALRAADTQALRAAAKEPGESGDTATVELARRLVVETDDAAWAVLTGRFGDLAAAFAGDWDALQVALSALPDEGVDVGPLAAAALAAAPTPGAAASVGWSMGARLGDGKATWTADWTARVDAAVGAAGGVEATPGRGDEQLLGSVPDLPTAALEDLADALYYRGLAGGEGAFAQAALLLGAAAIRETDGEALKNVDGRGWVVLPEGLSDPVLRAQEGRVHDLLSALRKAELPAVAPPIYEAMLRLHGEAFTWPYRYAGHLRDTEQWAAAEAQARVAVEFGYGDNRLRAAGRLAEILLAQERAEEARAVLTEALSAPAPTLEGVRTHRYRAALQTQLDALAAG